MILTNQQRDALITEITAAISGNARTSLLFSGELEKGRSLLCADANTWNKGAFITGIGLFIFRTTAGRSGL